MSPAEPLRAQTAARYLKQLGRDVSRRGRPSLLDRSLDDIEELAGGDAWVPDSRVVFQGSHAFAGVRQLVEQGVVDDGGRRVLRLGRSKRAGSGARAGKSLVFEVESSVCLGRYGRWRCDNTPSLLAWCSGVLAFWTEVLSWLGTTV